jgi:glutamate racemase
MDSSAPIGVFDSGIGGLTVVRELMALMPDERIIYLGDTARVPYGVRSEDTVRRYALEGTSFLLGKGIKLLVVACNTVSAVGLDEVSGVSDVPVVGVIEPGARAAVLATAEKCVGVIGTEATVSSGAYLSAIRRIDDGVEVLSATCPLFVPLAEEGWTDGDVPRLAADKYLSGLREAGIDSLVLGCTHYPLLKPVIAAVMGEGISLIDSATETAREVKALLEEKRLLRGPGGGGPAFFVTDSPEKFRSVGGRFLKRELEDIRLTELTEVH